ncbi:TPA: carbon monoxide dehydrogenase [Candidatus Poribacteria bacterium]|nr:carbon monoxide dehydrogenase [Candidatus Poribacteria bacterium]
MSFTIGVAGKGGTGKTTVAALIIRHLKKTGRTPILAVDADPNSNLGDSIGLPAETSIGTVLDEFLKSKLNLPQGMPKSAYLEVQLNRVIVESEEVDLVSMGRPEGPGCYCYPNELLRKFLDVLSGNYPYIVMDNEAGMEHLSRRTTRELDLLFLVSDPTVKGIRSAGRLKRLAEELDLNIKQIHLVVNRANGDLDLRLIEEMEKEGLELLQIIPEDELLPRYDLEYKPLLELPESSKAVKAIDELMSKVDLG